MEGYLSTRKGFVLPAVIILMIFITILGIGVLELGTMENIQAIKAKNRTKAFYLAEAGGQKAMSVLSSEDWTDDPFWGTSHQLGDGTFTVMKPVNADTTTVRSTGVVKDQEQTISLTVRMSQSGGVFSQGVYGSEEILMTGSSSIYGYNSETGEIITEPPYSTIAGSNTLIDMNGNNSIIGNAQVADGGEIRLPSWNPDAIAGEASEDGPEQDLQDVQIPNELLTMPYTQQGDSGLGGNYRIRNFDYRVQRWPFVATMGAGDYRFDDFTLRASAQLEITGDVRLYVEGSMDMTGNTDINIADGATLEIYLGEGADFDLGGSSAVNNNGDPGNVVLYSASDQDIDLTGNVGMYGAIYAPDANVTLAGSSPLWGGVVAKSVEMSGNVSMYYDVNLIQEILPGEPGSGSGPPGPPGPGQIQIIDWTKGKNWRGYYE